MFGAVKASEWIPIAIAGLGILGTLSATVIAQRGEAERALRTQATDEARRAEARQDALQRERREAIRADYREVLRFLARTRHFVLELRFRLTNLEWVTAHLSTDAREVEDLEARAAILRQRFLDELPEIQTLVGAWGSDDVVALFDEIDDSTTKIPAALSAAVHFKVLGERQAFAVESGLAEIDKLLNVLKRARTAVYSEQEPR